ncbi:hypothetical protein BGZ57DRAFT_948258 [Hyaloscypha finlandica]|nr:hypothetical protein BGZ57DRAFT_948258 [Hyaloscypha finlandica]
MSDIDYDLDSDNEAQEMAEAEPAHSNKNRPRKSQVGIEVKKLLKDLPFDEQYQMLQELTRGPKVTVLVGKEEKPHIQPKNLLCYYSSFFDKAFTSGFREASERTIRLPECSDMTYDCARTKADKLNLYIDFIMFADCINLMGPFDSVLQGIRSLLLSRTALLPEHIRTAAQLPYGDPLRNLIAQACEELDTLEGFASDLVRAFTSSIRGNPRFIDPLSKEYLDPYKRFYDSYQLPQHPEKIPKTRAAPRRVSFAKSFDGEVYRA